MKETAHEADDQEVGIDIRKIWKEELDFRWRIFQDIRGIQSRLVCLN